MVVPDSSRGWITGRLRPRWILAPTATDRPAVGKFQGQCEFALEKNIIMLMFYYNSLK